MDKKAYLSLILFLASITIYAQGLKNIRQIEFSTSSRNGDFKEAIVTKKTIKIKYGNRRENNKTIDFEKDICKKDYKSLHKLLKKLEVDSISKLISPTNKRAFDGADHSMITITTIDNNKTEHRFDDLNPHQDLTRLMEFILDLFPEKTRDN